MHLYGGIMTALYEREKTGKGRIVEVSMQEAVYASLRSNLGMYHGSGGKLPPRTGNRHGGLAEAPYNVYPTRDGYVAIICNNNRHFHALLTAMKREELKDDPRFADLKSRIQHIDDGRRTGRRVDGDARSRGHRVAPAYASRAARARARPGRGHRTIPTCTRAARCSPSIIRNTGR